jgi:2-polyprenyl-6-methoxyphenol hydroxylase-like FAD-dependent oxidoreductase
LPATAAASSASSTPAAEPAAAGRGLVVAPTGNSKIRTLSTITATELGAHLDICWYEVPHRDDDPPLSGLGIIAEPGASLAVLGQADSWQLGYLIPAGTFPALRTGGIGPVIGAFRRRLPWLGDRLDGLTEVNQLTLLPVRITSVDRWSEPGLLLIGDAAHVISPVGGNGLNFAALDAVEAANRLVGPLLADPVDPEAVDVATAAVEAARRPLVDRDQQQQKRAKRARWTGCAPPTRAPRASCACSRPSPASPAGRAPGRPGARRSADRRPDPESGGGRPALSGRYRAIPAGAGPRRSTPPGCGDRCWPPGPRAAPGPRRGGPRP